MVFDTGQWTTNLVSNIGQTTKMRRQFRNILTNQEQATPDTVVTHKSNTTTNSSTSTTCHTTTTTTNSSTTTTCPPPPPPMPGAAHRAHRDSGRHGARGPGRGLQRRVAVPGRTGGCVGLSSGIQGGIQEGSAAQW